MKDDINPLGTIRHSKTMDMKRLRERSMSGEERRRDRQRRRQIREEEYKHRRNTIITGIITCAISFGMFAGMPHVAAKIHEWQIENDPIERITDEYSHVISEAVSGRSNDNLTPLYEYYMIAQYISNSGQFDNGLFATYRAFSLRTDLETDERVSQSQVIHDVDRVLQYTEYETFENYLAARGYSDIHEYEEEMTQKIQLEDDIRKVRERSERELQRITEELDEINQEHPLTSSEGGKSL